MDTNNTPDQTVGLPDWDFPHFANYSCCICPSREGPFYQDRTGKKGVDFLCQSCHTEVVEIRSYWAVVDENKRKAKKK